MLLPLSLKKMWSKDSVVLCGMAHPWWHGMFLWLSIHGRAEPVEQWLLLSPLRALLLPARAGEDLQEPSEVADSDGVYTMPKKIMYGALGRQGECQGLSFPYFPIFQPVR